MRNMCGVKLIDKKSTKDLMQMLDMNETIDQLAKSNSVRWYGHALRKDKNNFLRSLDLKVKGTRIRGRPKKSWLKAVIEQSRKVGLNENDANSCSRWRLGVNTISKMMRQKPANSVIWRQNRIFSILYYYYYHSTHTPKPDGHTA